MWCRMAMSCTSDSTHRQAKEAAMGENVQLMASDGHKFDAYKATHNGAYRGGLVLIQEIFGVTPHIKELCEEFSCFGYDVLAPSIFDRIEPEAAFGYTPDEVEKARQFSEQAGVVTPILDIEACVNELGKAGPVAITGFCYGGSLVWMAAAGVRGLACAVGFYGRLIPDHIDQKPACPTMLHFGEHDALIPLEGVHKVAEAHPDVTIHVYDADHGFWSDRPQNHNAEAKALSCERTLAFFDKHMAG